MDLASHDAVVRGVSARVRVGTTTGPEVIFFSVAIELSSAQDHVVRMAAELGLYRDSEDAPEANAVSSARTSDKILLNKGRARP